MRYKIIHRTSYHYASPVRDSFNEARLHPVNNEQQTIESFLLKVLPATRLSQYHDFCSNIVYHFEIPEPHQSLTVESQLRVRTHNRPVLHNGACPWPLARIGEAGAVARCYEFLQPSRYVDMPPDAWRQALDSIQGISDTWQAALALMRFVHTHVTYKPNSTHVQTTMSEVLAKRAGVCQDFAHVLIGLCRSVKIPALYVSGYLATETASATHAWVEVFIPSVGWCGLDPTHDRPIDDTYIKIAIGRDYSDVPPITGHYRGSLTRQMTVDVKIEQIED